VANILRGRAPGGARNRIRDVDRGYKKLFRTLKKSRLQDLVVTVGVHASAGGHKSGDLTVAEVGAFHEFGLGNNPERSFIRAWFDETKGTNRKLLLAVYRKVLKGDLDEARALGVMGAAFAGQIQERISKGIPPELAPETVERKGSSKPLIDTGQLRASVTFEVRNRAQVAR
jgi:hypothetical protein